MQKYVCLNTMIYCEFNIKFKYFFGVTKMFKILASA